MAKKKLKTEWLVNVSFSYGRLSDNAVRRIGRGEDFGSGYCFIDNKRDLSLGFKTKSGADNSKVRLKDKFGRKVSVQVISLKE